MTKYFNNFDEKKAKLAIILVNWNGTRDTNNCINSISKSSFKNYEIIVVDNGSEESELKELVDCRFPIDLIKTGENLGYTGGNNVGIRHAIDQKADYLLLLNNDTLLASDALENMMSSAMSDQNIGILSPKIFFYPDVKLIWFAGASFNNITLMGYLSGYKKIITGFMISNLMFLTCLGVRC